MNQPKWLSLFKATFFCFSTYGGFLKWYPTTIGFPTKNDHFGGVLGVPPFKETPTNAYSWWFHFWLGRVVFFHAPGWVEFLDPRVTNHLQSVSRPILQVPSPKKSETIHKEKPNINHPIVAVFYRVYTRNIIYPSFGGPTLLPSTL